MNEVKRSTRTVKGGMDSLFSGNKYTGEEVDKDFCPR
jgi:hypothetical protein